MRWKTFKSLFPLYLPTLCMFNVNIMVSSNSADVMPKVPSLTLLFPLNNSFVVHDPVFPIYGDQVDEVFF